MRERCQPQNKQQKNTALPRQKKIKLNASPASIQNVYSAILDWKAEGAVLI